MIKMFKIFIYFLPMFFWGCAATPVKEEPVTPQNTSDSTVVLTDVQLKNGGVETGLPVATQMQTVLKVNGLIDVPPQNKVTISFPGGGYVKSTDLLEGMEIKKGQVLAVMEDQSLIQVQQDYLLAKSRSKFFEKELIRQQALNITKASSDKVYEQAQNEASQEMVRLKALKEKLELIGINSGTLNENNISRSVNIRSPISGFVAAVRVNIGKYVSPTDVLFELVNTKDLHLALNVFEKDLQRIKPGQTVRASLTGDSGMIYLAKVMLVGKTLDSARTAMVHCHFTGHEPPLLPGMYISAEIEITNQQLLAVPDDAIVRVGEQEFIFVKETTNRFRLMAVDVLSHENGLSAVSRVNSSLASREVVVKNAYVVLMKMKNTGGE